MLKYIEKLLNNQKVEWKKLGEVAEIKTGQLISKEIINNNLGIYPVINSGKDPLGFINIWNTENDPIGITSRGVGVGSITWQEGRYYRGNLNYSVTILNHNILINRFLYYLLISKQKNIHSLCTFQAIPALNASNLKKLEIPIPPLSIQEEIVSILDKFTALNTTLNTALNTEKTLREKQYQAYLDKLIDESDFPRVKLKDIALSMYRGTGIKKDQLVQNGDPCIRYGEIYTTYNAYFTTTKSFTIKDNIKNAKFAEYGDILFAITGESVKDIAKSTTYLGKDDILVGGDILVMKHNQNPKYISYALSSKNSVYQKTKGKEKNKVVHSSSKDIENIEIPLPSLEIQEQIANTLDKFNTISTSLTEGLPREIELRNKQYQYYLNQLLNFNPCEVK